MMRAVLTLTLLVAMTHGALAASVREQIEFLSADELQGRLTGDAGAQRAADYIESQLKALGAQPMAGSDGLQQEFQFTAGSKDAGTRLTIQPMEGAPVVVEGTEQVQALSFSDARAVEGEIAFAGYGLKMPQDSDFPYDSYAGVDVKGKIALVLRYFPEEVDGHTRALLARYSGLRYKALQAREAGAIALLLVTGPNSPNAGEVVPMQFDTALSGSGIVAASIDLETAEKLFALGADKTLAESQTSMDTGNPHVSGFDLAGVKVNLDVKIERQRRTGLNVVGLLPATTEEVLPGTVALGAHYDHLGLGEGGNSLAGAEEKGMVHNGADDNASGVAAVLRAAARLAQVERPRDVVFGFWGGEELGLLGSTAFVNQLKEGKTPVGAYLNFDMVGRLREEKLSVQAVGSSDAWPGLLEQANVVHGFDMHLQNDPYLPTDSQAFYLEGVPTLNFFTGSHEDYHKPSDDFDKINVEGVERIADMAVMVTSKLAARGTLPERKEVERTRTDGRGRDSMRAFTGTIPDYTTEVEGLLLSGVIGGGPAEEAGLRKGDVIVEFAGQSIKNIYDYTYALDAVKIDVPVQVLFLRDGEKLEVTLTPRSRK